MALPSIAGSSLLLSEGNADRSRSRRQMAAAIGNAIESSRVEPCVDSEAPSRSSSGSRVGSAATRARVLIRGKDSLLFMRKKEREKLENFRGNFVRMRIGSDGFG